MQSRVAFFFSTVLALTTLITAYLQTLYARQVVDDAVGDQMVVQARMAAQLVAYAEKTRGPGQAQAEFSQIAQFVNDWLKAKYSKKESVKDYFEFCITNETGYADKGYELRLISQVTPSNNIPIKGTNLIIIAEVDGVLHFRIFDPDGTQIVDTTETRLKGRAPQIEALREQLKNLWPPRVLSSEEKDNVISAVTSMVNHARPKVGVITGNYVAFQFPITNEMKQDPKNRQTIDFMPLLGQRPTPVVQKSQQRVVDTELFKYVGVGGLDSPRIVQVGYNAEFLDELENALLFRALGLAGAMFGVGLVISLGAARILISPVERLTKAAETIALQAERYDSELFRGVRERRDELGRLARVLDQTAQGLSARIRLLFESMRSAVLKVDSRGKITYANPYACELFGYAKEEIENQHMSLIIPGNDVLGEVEKALESLRDAGRGVHVNENIRKDKSRVLVYWSNQAIKPDGHGEIEYLCVANDVSSLALNALVESMGAAILKLDDGERITYLNPFAEQLLGYPAGELVGQPVSRLFDDEEDLAWFRQVLRDERVDDSDRVTRVRCNGHRERLYLNWRCRPVHTAEPCPNEYLCLAVDVTRLKRTEQKLRRAIRRAVRANETKSKFVAQVSHELRTPLHVMMLAGDLLQSGTRLSIRQEEYVGVIDAAAEVQLAQVGDILDFQAMEEDRIVFEEKEFDLHEALGGICRMLALAAHDKNLELVLDIRPDVPVLLKGDANRLRQVVINLVNNAIRYTKSGEVVLRVSVAEQQSDQVEMLFAITDTGVGIAEVDFEKLFEPFETLGKREGGTGLGLTIAKRLVERMQGRIWVESQLGHGSTFFFTVGLGLVSGQEPEDYSWREGLRARRILIVDDNSTSRGILAATFRDWGADPLEENDISSALKTLGRLVSEGHHADLILCDADLFVVDGTTFGEAVRGKAGPVPVVMMATFGLRTRQDQIVEVDFGPHLIKPVVSSALARIVTNVLGLPMPQRSVCLDPNADPAGQVKVAPQTLSILLAEDSPIIQSLMNDSLTRDGHRVVAVGDGRLALESFAHQAFDIVLLDVEMPGLNGFQVAKAIRRREQSSGRSRTPILALTAHAVKGYENRCHRAGMDGYLTKPFRLSALYDGIKQLIPNFVRPTRSSAIAARPSVVSNGRSHSKESLVHLDRDAVMSVAPDVNSLRSLVRTFQELGPGVLEEVGQAVAELDHERLREAAHKLGGAMLQFFWQLPIDLAAQLETMGVEEHLDGAPSVYARLAGEFTRLAIATSRLEDVNKP